jgi:hypothetical protein
MKLSRAVDAWLISCQRRGAISRNTIAVGIVVLHKLRQKVPLAESDILSKGGEISGSRAGLPSVLATYGISEKYLKEATTRQAHQDGQRLLESVEYGKQLAKLPPAARDLELTAEIEKLARHAREWLARKHIKIACDRQWAPSAWIQLILEEAKGKSGGKVEQHLVGAKLEQRHPNIEISNHPGHAADVQTGRVGDFAVGATRYHVTAAPGLAVVEKCAANISSGLHPILLVPRSQAAKAVHLAEALMIEKRLSVVAIEDFVGENIIEMSHDSQTDFLSVLRSIVDKYNARLAAVETDMSLKIEID